MKLAIFCGSGALDYDRMAEDLTCIRARYPDLTIRAGGLCAAIRWGHENSIPVEEDNLTGADADDLDAGRKRDRRLIDGADVVLAYRLTHPRRWPDPHLDAALAYVNEQGKPLWRREIKRTWLTDLMDEDTGGGWPRRPDEEE